MTGFHYKGIFVNAQTTALSADEAQENDLKVSAKDTLEIIDIKQNIIIILSVSKSFSRMVG